VNRPARKRFGQNFLIDQNVIQKIVNTISPSNDDLLIEVGPGRAAITVPLLERCAELAVVEIDRDLVADLERQFSGNDKIHIHNEDALKTDFSLISQGRPYRLLGNLPYNISTPLIFHILEQQQTPVDMHFMLQKEVVRRMAAGPGDKSYGRLSIMVQNRCEVSALFDVPARAFDPVPKVDSAFVRLQPRSEPLSGIQLQAALDKIVRQAFSLRRKTLRNSLRTLITAEQLLSAGVDPGLRAEQLELEQFFNIAKLI
jgi:16S rRNA (adenine1518-N6/adenine1519-N6)-dimethyltransferase